MSLIEYAYVAEDLSAAWGLYVATMIASADGWIPGGPLSYSAISVGSFNGSLTIEYGITGGVDDARVMFVAVSQPAATKIPVRGFLSGQGAATTSVIKMDPTTTVAEYLDVLDITLADAKRTVLEDATDAVTITGDILSKGALSDFSTQVIQVLRVEATTEYLVSQDTVRIMDGAVFDLGNTPGVLPIGIPPGIAGPGAIGFEQVVKALNDIALREFTVRFNHGAQQFSASGGVAIP